jgi:hypothetical protein
LDTAADISAVPLNLLSAWNAEPESEIVVSGFDATPMTIATFTVGIEFADTRIHRSEVIAIPGDHALLGRDILNLFHIELNGPELTFTMRGPHRSQA